MPLEAPGDGAVRAARICPVCGAASTAATVAEDVNRVAATVMTGTELAADEQTIDHVKDQLPPPPTVAPALPPVEEIVPGYEAMGVLGRGGMGIVYRARHRKLKRLVALKMVLSGAHASPEHLARFRTEAEAVARLQHPNIVQIYEVGEHEGQPWFSLEFVEGGTLAQYLARSPQAPRLAAQVIETLARAVHYAHQHGIVHRDLKPANVLLQIPEARAPKAEHRGEHTGSLSLEKTVVGNTPSEAGMPRQPAAVPEPVLLTADLCPKITDFGLAKQLEDDSLQTQSGAILGTPSYMAPEQAGGQSHAVGPGADIYALGAMLYEMLTGRPPFKATTIMETVNLVLKEEPVPPRRLQPRVPADLDTICLKCLHKDPLKRYLSGEALAEDLRRFQANEAILARPTSAAERLLKWSRRRPALAGLVAVSAAAMVALLAGWFAFTLQIQKQRDRAEANYQRALLVVNHMLETASAKTWEYEPRLEEKREAMLKKALELFSEFLGEKSTDPEVRQKTARAQQKVADLYRILRQPQDASQHYQEAIDLVGPFQDRPEWAYVLAECYNWQGEILRSTFSLKRAQEVYAKSRGLLQGLLNQYPDNLTYRKDLARSHYNSGLYFKESDDAKNAAVEFRAAIDLLRVSIPQGVAPEVAADMRYAEALSYLNLATVLFGPGKDQEAVDAASKAITLLDDLVAKNPEVPDYRKDLAVAHNNRGNVRARLYRVPPQNAELLQQAEDDHRQAVALLAKVRSDYPRYPKFGHELANTFNSLGALLVTRQDKAGARDAWTQATVILDKLAAEHPKAVDFQGDLGMTLGNLGWLLGQEQKWTDARGELNKAITLVQTALKANPKHPDYSLALRNQYLNLARTELQLKNHAAAARAAEGLAARKKPDDYYLAARFLAQCLPLVEADKDLSADDRAKYSAQYADHAVALLGLARKEGLKSWDAVLTGPLFEPLRRQPAFAVLRKELQ